MNIIKWNCTKDKSDQLDYDDHGYQWIDRHLKHHIIRDEHYQMELYKR